MGKGNEEQYRKAAREHLHVDGDVEFDEECTVSMGDDAGAYVQAWVWVDDDLLEVQS